MWCLGVSYWLLSVANTGLYFANLRVVELLLSTTAVWLLMQNPRYACTALWGFTLSSFSVSVAFLPHGTRLGMAFIGEFFLGNPINLGLPLVLVLLVACAHGGRTLLLQRRPLLRATVILVTIAALLLTTSRTSWIVAIVVVAGAVLDANGYHRALLVSCLALVLLGGAALFARSERGQHVAEMFDRAVSSERSWQQRTSGRTDQWRLFPAVLRDAPAWGHGAGSGPDVYARYSARQDGLQYGKGVRRMWHSLYLHLGVEAGLLGWLALAIIVVPLLSHNGHLWGECGERIPMIAGLAYLVLGLGSIALDFFSGVYLGMAVAGYHAHEDDEEPYALESDCRT
jgi:O-antigen ligase